MQLGQVPCEMSQSPMTWSATSSTIRNATWVGEVSKKPSS
jgi:hypothetical protein